MCVLLIPKYAVGQRVFQESDDPFGRTPAS